MLVQAGGKVAEISWNVVGEIRQATVKQQLFRAFDYGVKEFKQTAVFAAKRIGAS